jgi:hypothetical protein
LAFLRKTLQEIVTLKAYAEQLNIYLQKSFRDKDTERQVIGGHLVLLFMRCCADFLLFTQKKEKSSTKT